MIKSLTILAVIILVFTSSCGKDKGGKKSDSIGLTGSQELNCSDGSKSFTLAPTKDSYTFKFKSSDKEIEVNDLKCSNSCDEDTCHAECAKLNEGGITLDLNRLETDKTSSELQLKGAFYPRGVGGENEVYQEISIRARNGWDPLSFSVKDVCNFETLKINNSPEMRENGSPTIDLVFHRDYSSRTYYKIFPNKNNLYSLSVRRYGHIGMNHVYRSFNLACETTEKSKDRYIHVCQNQDQKVSFKLTRIPNETNRVACAVKWNDTSWDKASKGCEHSIQGLDF